MKSFIQIFWFFYLISGGTSDLTSSPYQEYENRQLPQYQLRNSYTAQTNKNPHGSWNYYKNHPKDYDEHFDKSPYFINIRNNYQNVSREKYFESSRYVNDENSRKSSTGVYRTYGRGRAQITRKGETVYVPNKLGQRNAQRGSFTIKPTNGDDREGRIPRGRCRECPPDQTVVATKQNNFVILPVPCPSNPKMWNHHSGPRPGAKIREGLHVIRGTLEWKKTFCEYRYQVLVHRCPALKPPEEDTTIECTEDDVWGSQCTINCGSDKEPLGPTVLECLENLTWSHPIPICKSKMDCLAPKVKTNSKIWCQTANMSAVEGNFIPNGSTCRFNRKGRKVLLSCKNGTWKVIRKIKADLEEKDKAKYKNKIEKKENICDPNPCQNGGTCLKNNSQKEPICVCRPQTQGTRCELRECDYNICYNDGMCFFKNNERTCYCFPEFSGEQCQDRADR